jgi:hypothetical protein
VSLKLLICDSSDGGGEGVTADFKILKATPGKSEDSQSSKKDEETDGNNEEDNGGNGDEEINYDDYQNVDDAMLNSRQSKKK